MTRANSRLEAIGIVNGWNVAAKAKKAGLPDVFISYYAAESGRLYLPAHWAVTSTSHDTDPDAHFLYHRTKVFKVFGVNERPGQLKAAQEWVAEKYKITEWAKIPGLSGYWFPKVVADYIKAQVKEAEKNG